MADKFIKIVGKEKKFLKEELDKFNLFELYMLRNSLKTKIDLEGIHYDLNCIKHELRKENKDVQYNVPVDERLHDEEFIRLIDETINTIIKE